MYPKRITSLQKTLQENNIDALLVSSHANIVYLTGFSSFSTEEREAYIIVTSKKVFLITDARYTEAVAQYIPHVEIIERSASNPFSEIFAGLAKIEKIQVLGFEPTDISVAEYHAFNKYFNCKSATFVEELRLIKSSDEIELIRNACQLGDKTFNYLIKQIRQGMTEKELAFEITQFIRKNNADISFPPIVCFGKTSSDIHHTPTETVLEPNSFVLLDFGVKLENYCSDMTRTLFFGNASEKQKNMYNTVLEAQQKVITFMEQGLKSNTLPNGLKVDHIARTHIAEKGFVPYPHGLGHGIGLQVHEKPTLSLLGKNTIKPGMVFSVEPGIYIPGFGGVRIEDLVTILDNKVEYLTNSPRKLLVI